MNKMATLLLINSLCFDRDGCRFICSRQSHVHYQIKMAEEEGKCPCAVSHDLSACDLIGRNNVMSGVAHANVGQMSRDPGLS